jgi:bifunctional UDP-N-acetylglucosamine pyrophosphorylase / glucosamine-1-phosphate N-acetyltransferase
MSTGIVILAAGNGSRLNSAIPKALVPLMGQPLISHLMHQIPAKLPTYIVVSSKYQKRFQELFPTHTILTQDPPKGTAHALTKNYPHLKHHHELIILNADTPLVPPSLIMSLITHPHPNTLVGFNAHDTSGYGQISTDNGLAIRITEACDRQGIHHSNLCYAGIMKLSRDYLGRLCHIPASPITGEFYLTRLISPKSPFQIIQSDPTRLHGINTPAELMAAETSLKTLIISDLLAKHTLIDDYHTVYIASGSIIQKHCHFGPQVSLHGQCQIGNHCHIGQGSILTNVTLSDHVTILPYTIISDSSIDSDSTIGPFAHIQENTTIGKKSYIGNFVEVKRSLIKDGVKAKHLSYLGDSYIDNCANIGAGVITCNYVPWKTHKLPCYIGPHAFIGAGCILIGPSHIGDYAICAAGSVIPKLVLPKSFAISRPSFQTKSSLFVQKGQKAHF